MIIATTDFVPGKEVKEYIGFVKGSTVQSKHIGKDLLAGLKTIIGGEIKEYTEQAKPRRLDFLPAESKCLQRKSTDQI
jgi:uncharacterized protein YbjQ (UPF0145 family)